MASKVAQKSENQDLPAHDIAGEEVDIPLIEIE